MNSEQKWTIQEENYLKNMKETSPTQITKIPNLCYQNQRSSSKQCSERQESIACSSISQQHPNIWNFAKHVQMVDLFGQYGSHWKQIAQIISGLSENTVKNRFNGSVRKFVRKINNICRKVLPKFTKPIKYDAIIRIFQAAEFSWQLYPHIKEETEELKQKILNMLKEKELSLMQKQLINLASLIHSFNLKTRSYNLKKSCPMTKKKITDILSQKKAFCSKSIQQPEAKTLKKFIDIQQAEHSFQQWPNNSTQNRENDFEIKKQLSLSDFFADPFFNHSNEQQVLHQILD